MEIDVCVCACVCVAVPEKDCLAAANRNNQLDSKIESKNSFILGTQTRAGHGAGHPISYLADSDSLMPMLHTAFRLAIVH